MARTLFGRGSKGALIADLQSGLVDKGIPLAKIDGDYGPRTEDAVKTYQAHARSPQTGVVDTDEWVSVTGTPVPFSSSRAPSPIEVTAYFVAE